MSAADEIRALRGQIEALRNEVAGLKFAIARMQLDVSYAPHEPYRPYEPGRPSPSITRPFIPSYPQEPYITWEINYGPPLVGGTYT